MNAATERKIIPWFHLLASIPILGYVYDQVASIPKAAAAIRWVLLPAATLSN